MGNDPGRLWYGLIGSPSQFLALSSEFSNIDSSAAFVYVHAHVRISGVFTITLQTITAFAMHVNIIGVFCCFCAFFQPRARSCNHCINGTERNVFPDCFCRKHMRAVDAVGYNYSVCYLGTKRRKPFLSHICLPTSAFHIGITHIIYMNT